MILIIEDEVSVRSILHLFLEFSGYRAMTAATGEEGLAIYRENQQLVRVIITDMRMPFMHGLEVIHRLRAINPGVRIIAISGMAGSETLISEEPGRLVFRHKPVAGPEILDAVQGLLRK